MNTRRTTLLVAILLAIGTGWLTLNYINGIKGSGQAASQQRVVLVAATDIPPRTQIQPGMVRREVRPASAVDTDALTDTVPAVGSVSLISIPAGSQLTASKVGRPADVGLTVRLANGTRAVSIQIDKVKGVSGLIQPGDRVDIIAVPPRAGDDAPPAATILRGIKVLAVGASLETSSATPSPEEQNSTTVTLEVTPRQADLIAMADQNASLRLALRSPREPLNSEPTEALHFPSAAQPAPQQVAAAPAPAPAMQPAPPPAVQQQPHTPARSDIMIIDGDRIGYDTSSSQGQP
jgi:pilus assembly protein CpaB